VRQELVSFGVGGQRISVVPAPVDVSHFASATAGDIRGELRLSKSHIVVAAVGHAVPVKGWDVLIRAFAQVTVRLPDVCLLLVGSTTSAAESQYTQKLRCLATSLGVLDRIVFAGQRSDIAEILHASDIFAFPSRSDGQGLALVEAMAAGLPCVAARTGGIPEVVEDGADGLLFEREDPDGLASKILSLAEDSVCRRRLGKNAKRKARQFGMAKYVKNIMQHYDELLGRRRCFQ